MFSNAVAAYSRGLLPLAAGKSLLVTSGGVLNKSGDQNRVTYGIDDYGRGFSTGATYNIQNALSSEVLGVPADNVGGSDDCSPRARGDTADI